MLTTRSNCPRWFGIWFNSTYGGLESGHYPICVLEHMEDMGPGAFPVEEVHKISVLDIRLANADRHAGNILLSKEQVDGKTLLKIGRAHV